MSFSMSRRQPSAFSCVRYVIMGLLALVLSACNPTAKFSYSPDEPVVGQEVTFDASASTTAKPEKLSIERYIWNFFGDTTEKKEGKVVKHTFTKPGKYEVTLTVVDSQGQVNSYTKAVSVADAALVNAKVAVTGVNGEYLVNAKVTVNGTEATTDKTGRVSLDVVSADTYVVKAELAGFVTQSISVSEKELGFVNVSLKNQGQDIAIANIAGAQTVNADALGASVSFGENTFANQDGTVATGAAKVVITPWNIATSDSAAFLGNGQAVDAQGNAAELISAGMMTVDFYDAQGNKLQIADGKSADISMNAILNFVDGKELKNGTQIPMWTFDEATGKWKEEGVGTVQNGKLTAKVTHFSTWNWDYKFEAGGSIKVSCADSSGNVPCYIKAKVTLTDGSVLTKSRNVSAEGATIVNMPTNANVSWAASTDGGQQGFLYQPISAGDVVITLAEPTTKHQTKCVLEDGTAVACVGQVTYKNGPLKYPVREFATSDQGALISSVNQNVTNTLFSAQSAAVFKNDNGKSIIYTGSTSTTNREGEVIITLNKAQVVSDVFTIECRMREGAAATQPPAGSVCTVTLKGYNQYEAPVLSKEYSIPLGQRIVLPYSLLADIDFGNLSATIKNTGFYYYRSFSADQLSKQIRFPEDKVSILLAESEVIAVPEEPR